jgi:signal transduction histidine kinase
MSEQASTTATSVPADSRWQLLGGDRFYTIARWGVLALLLVIGSLLTQEPVWPPQVTMHPIMLLIWGYALFNLLVTVALFVPPLNFVVNGAFIIDILFLTLLTLFSPDQRDQHIFYPLYFLPLIGAAFRLRSAQSLLTGLVATSMYVGAYLFAHTQAADGQIPRDVIELVALGLRALAMICIPWLTSGLAERWGADNRRSVALAEQKTEQAFSEANAYRDQMRSLYEVAYTLSTTMNYASVLDSTLTESRKLVPYLYGMVMLSTGEPDELYIAAAYGLSDTDRALRIQLSKGSIGQALRSSDPCLVEDVSREPELQSIKALARCKAGCLVPLRAGLRTYGIMLIASDRTGAYNQEQLGMLTALANYAIIALHNAQLVYDLREERAKLLSKEEEVRHQLARDLHDGPAQAMAAIAMNIEFIKRLLQRDPSRIVSELDKLGALAKRTTHEVRTMLFELRPLVLETQGLDTTLRQYLERFQGNGTEIILDSAEIDANLDTKAEGTLFNIIQESVNNALKYAKAPHIWVRLRQTEKTLEVTVQDDGAGFDLQKVLASYEKRGSFGLLNIEERAKLIGGMAELHSAPGQGTRVRVIVPLN